MTHPMNGPVEDAQATTSEEAMTADVAGGDDLMQESAYDTTPADPTTPRDEVVHVEPTGDVSVHDPEGERHVARANETLED